MARVMNGQTAALNAPQTLEPAPLAGAPARSLSRLGARAVSDAGREGMDVVVYSSRASDIDLVLLDGPREALTEQRIGLFRARNGLWHAHIPGVRPGQRYGFRVYGEWEPATGEFANPHKLLTDPYARGLSGDLDLVPEIFGHTVTDVAATHTGLDTADPRDSARFVPHSVLLPEPDHLRQRERLAARPRVPWAHTVLYETHVRGFTLLRQDVPEPLRGTYAGMAHPATIAHLKNLGITSVELLPIHAFTTEHAIAARGLPNYWGYSTLGFFAPEPRYATEAARQRARRPSRPRSWRWSTRSTRPASR